MPISAAELVNRAANRAYEPPPLLSVADWADENRYLGGDSSEQGKYRTSRTPYARQIMDCLSPFHPARHIVWEKSVQVGATTVGLNWIGYIIAHAPAPTIITLPSEGVAKEWSNQRLTQLVDETPCLQGRILDAAKKGSGNTIYLKRIAGTSVTIKIAWSSSAKKLRSTPAANLLSDEVDGFEGDTEGEGNPLVLLDGRFVTFPRGKHFKISTPTSHPSRIHAEFLKGDQRYYFVPCPFCARFQRLDFHSLRWTDGPLGYECVGCRQRFPERFKTQFLARGMWVATIGRPELLKQGFDDPKVLAPILASMEQAKFVSFHLPAQYSPIGWYSWEQLRDDWQKAQASQVDLKAVINTKLAEVWVPKGKASDPEILFGRREDYLAGAEAGVVPAGGLFITGSADIHPDRIECELKAWGRDKQSWSLCYEVFRGQVTQAWSEPWQQLDRLIRREWQHADGATMWLWGMGIDTGFCPDPVYEFCRRFPQPRYAALGTWIETTGLPGMLPTVFPLKGGHSWDKAIETVSDLDSAKRRGGLRIVTMGSSFLKLAVSGWLQVPYKPGEPFPPYFAHYPNYEFGIFEGLCAESLVTDSMTGRREWKRHGRNEPLDLLGYNYGVAILCRFELFTDEDWAELERRVKPQEAVDLVARAPEVVEQRRPSAWLGERRKWFDR